MSIPQEEELRLKSKYGKGASMMLKMGLTAADLKKKPVAADPNVGRLGLGHAANSSRDDGEKSQCSSAELRRLNTDNSRSIDRENQLISSEPQPSTSSAHSAVTLSRANEFDAAGSVLLSNEKLDNNNEGEKSSTDILREVKRNINLLAENCERDMLANQENLELRSAKFEKLRKVKICLSKQIKNQLDTIDQMVELQEALATVNNKTSESNEEQLQRLLKLYGTIKRNDTVWKNMRFYRFVVPTIASLLEAEFASANWNPLIDPIEPAEMYVPWQKLLEDFPGEFQNLLTETYFPAFEKAVKDWDGADPELLTEMWTAWELYFSHSMQAYLRDQVLWPKFWDIIKKWDPKIPETFINPKWVSEWKYAIEITYYRQCAQLVGRRINEELQNWDPITETWPARLIFEIEWLKSTPMLEVVQIRKTMATQLTNMLLKMEFTYNNEDIKEVNAALRWGEFLGWSVMADAFLDGMILNWRKFLTTWMEREDVDFEEVKNWYLFWRNTMSKIIRACETVRNHVMFMLKTIEGHLETHNLTQATEKLSLENRQ